ncbi:MAG: LPXTG cell wall anchor domain-containing protein [Hydrogenobacter sp.]
MSWLGIILLFLLASILFFLWRKNKKSCCQN